MTVLQQDVGEVIREARGSFDSIILDVDNGPAALSTGGNVRLYESAGLRDARAALRPGGCVAFWSVAPDPAFERLHEPGRVRAWRCSAAGRTGIPGGGTRFSSGGVK